MKKCELCASAATMYCESDSASLCWDCDTKVHSANFLVEKHSRSLLCHLCQSPTAWSASGPKLGRTISVCESCVQSKVSEEDVDSNTEDEDDEDSSDHYDGDVDEEKDDNQVVPGTWPPSPRYSSSSGEESSSSKRLRQGPSDYCSDDDMDCCSSDLDSGADCVDSPSRVKRLKTETDHSQCELLDLGTSLIGDSLKRLYKHDTDIDAVIRKAPAVGSSSSNSH